MIDHKKVGQNTFENSNILYKNEIYRVDNPSNENSKNITFCQQVLNFGGWTAEKFRENGQKEGNLWLCKLGSGHF